MQTAVCRRGEKGEAAMRPRGKVTAESRFLALQGLGVGEFAHINGSLEAHLLGTHELLTRWNNAPFVCTAGLYHAVYGTQPMEALGIPHKNYSPSDRPHIRSIIGRRAEALVYLYGACDRDYFYPQIGSSDAVYRDRFTGAEGPLNRRTISALLELTLANELEICQGSLAFMEQHRDWFIDLFDRFERCVSPSAFAAYRETFGI
jgi:hypothetical protein